VVSDGNGESKVVFWETVSGNIRSEYEGHRGPISALAFAPDSRTLATGGWDTTVLLWDLTGKQSLGKLANTLTAQDRASLWSELESSDARTGHQALIRLVAAPADAVTIVARELKPVPHQPITDREIDTLIADLDADPFETREKASRALELVGKRAEAALRKALANKPSPEKRRRLQELLDALNGTTPSAALIRALRSVELLEQLGTPEARRHLEALAQGNPHAPLTLAAQAALRRLSGQR
jgi:hypothetical protein